MRREAGRQALAERGARANGGALAVGYNREHATRRALAAVSDPRKVVPWVDTGRMPHAGDPMTSGDLHRILVASEEAGLERFVAFDKGEFLGHEALRRQLEAGGPSIRLCCLAVDADGADAHGYEPVHAGGELVSYVMAGGYGHTVETSIALAYLPVEHATVGTEVEVEILGDRRPARVVEQPLYDPENARLLS